MLQEPVFLDLECNVLDESSYPHLLKAQRQKLFIFEKDEGIITLNIALHIS